MSTTDERAVVSDDVGAPVITDPDGLWLALVKACMHRAQVRHHGKAERRHPHDLLRAAEPPDAGLT